MRWKDGVRCKYAGGTVVERVGVAVRARPGAARSTGMDTAVVDDEGKGSDCEGCGGRN